MGVIENSKKLVLGGKEAFNGFMYNGSTLEKKNAKISVKKEELSRKIEAQKAEKATRKSQREEKSSIISRIFTRSEEIEVEEGQLVLYGADDEVYTCQLIELNQLVDEKYVPYEKSPKGQELLKRDLKTSKLFITDDGDIMKVNKVIEVKPEEFDEKYVYLMFDTNRVYYVIKFPVIRSF